MECVGRVNTPNTAQGLGDKRDALGAQPCPFCTWAAQFLWFGFFFFFFLKGSATAAVVSTRHRTVAFLMHQFRWFFLCSTWLSLREEPLSFYIFILLVSVQFSPQCCPTLCDPRDCSVPGLPVHHQLLQFIQTHVHWVDVPSNPLSSPSPPTFNFPTIRVISNDSVLCIRWPKYWSFSFSISPSNEYSGLISFRMDWLDLLAVHRTLKSLLQHHSSKASILQGSAFFIVQISHPYMTTGKTIALTSWAFVGKVMSLLLNMLSRLVITFLPRSKHLLISWL